MNRRLLTILLPFAAASLVAGCATFDSDAIARVGDTELQQDVLDDLLSVLPSTTSVEGQPPVPSDPTDADDVRQAINIWIQSQIQSDLVDERGLEIPPETLAQAAELLPQALVQEPGDTTRELLIGLIAQQQVLPTDVRPPSPELLELYSRGPDASGIICVSHILVEDLPAADEAKDRLDGGADFAEEATTTSTDPGSAASGGDLGCFFVPDFSAQFIPEFVEGALDAEVGEPTEPVESEFGFHVILVRDADNAAEGLAPFESDLRFVAQQADVSVDSRYGTFDASQVGVVPLG